MVRNYKRKKDKNWDENNLYLALKKVQDGQSCKATAAEFNIPRSTLQKKLKSFGDDSSKVFLEKAVGHSRVFNHEQEKALALYIAEMENKLMGLEGSHVRKLAYQFAERLKIPHTFNNEKKEAGKDWLRGFMSRHEFSHRKAEHTSSARANGFNKQAVQEFFTLLKDVMEQYKFTPDKIYNVDETNISVVPKSSPKIIAKRGRRQVGGLTACERGEGVTVEVCISAVGIFMPPMLIFPRVKENLDFLEGAPPGAWAEFHKTGYMQTEIFTKWFKKFVEFSRAKSDDPVLLLLDGHATHVKNLDVIDYARENGVILLCFPPHCTHKMQPLDVGFNGPLNTCFGKEVNAFQRQGNRVTMRNLFSIFGKAFLQAAKIETAINSFRRCGIVPLNSEIFTDADFVVSGDASFSSSSNLNDAEKETQVSQLLNIVKSVVQEPDHGSRSDTTACEPSTLNPNSINDDRVDSIQIPLSYIIQAKPLINLLSSCMPGNEDVPFREINNINNSQTNSIDDSSLNQLSESQLQLTKQNPASSIIVTEKPSRKGQKKGQAAILTSDSYLENLVAQKTTSIKKEKMDGISSSRLAKKSTEPKTQSRKRKQITNISTPQGKKSRKPLENLNLFSIENSQISNAEFAQMITTDSILDPASFDNEQNIIAVPELFIVNNESFTNNKQEIYYVYENVAKDLNV